MVYTLVQGAQGYNHKLHYSLYGGVEYLPERVKFALKELLPLAAIPAVAIALLVAIVNFHVPVLSPATAGSDGIGTSGSQVHSLVLSANQTGSSTGSTSPSTAFVSSLAGPTSSTASTINPVTSLTPLGNDNGQGIVGGDTLPGPVESPAPTTTTVPVDTPLVQADATVSTQQPQAGVDVIVPLTSTTVNASVGL